MINRFRNIILVGLLAFLYINAAGQAVSDRCYMLGKAKLEAGQYDSALVYLDKSIAQNTYSQDVLFAKGMALYKKSQFAMAIREFEQVEKGSQGKASIWIARCYANMRDTENCLKALNIHMNSNYRLPESSLRMDADLNILENDPKYIEFWKNGEWYTALDKIIAEAGYLIKSKQYPDAVNILSDGLKKGYRKATLYSKRSEVYLAAGNVKLALDDLNQAISLDRRNPELLSNRAHLLYIIGKYKLSLEDFNAALKLEPDEAGLYIGRALAFNKSGFYEQASNDINFYLRLYPENDTAWYHSGNIHFDNGNFFEALNCYNNSLRLNQADARFFAARGATYIKTRTYQYAWNDLAMALDLNPKDSQSFLNKGIAALSLGKNDDACFCFDQAKKLGNKEAFNFAEKYCK